MLRNISAVTFMLVMTLLITLKHPVLGYCLCVNSYFTGDCSCELTKQADLQSSTCADNCCSSAQVESEKPAPCDDCTKRLNIDVSDFVWNASDQLPELDQHEFPNPAVYFTDSHLFTALTAVPANAPIRGDPPPWIDLDTSQGLPIYIRHSVLII